MNEWILLVRGTNNRLMVLKHTARLSGTSLCIALYYLDQEYYSISPFK